MLRYVCENAIVLLIMALMTASIALIGAPIHSRR
jgi:hypothetical protein